MFHVDIIIVIIITAITAIAITVITVTIAFFLFIGVACFSVKCGKNNNCSSPASSFVGGGFFRLFNFFLLIFCSGVSRQIHESFEIPLSFGYRHHDMGTPRRSDPVPILTCNFNYLGMRNYMLWFVV